MSSSEKIDFLEQKISRLKWANDDLRSKLFAAIQSAKRLAQAFGFKDLQHAKEALATTSFRSNVQHMNARIELLEAELEKHTRTSKDAIQANDEIRKEHQEAQREPQRLREELPESHERQRALFEQLKEKESPSIPTSMIGVKRKREVCTPDSAQKENTSPLQSSTNAAHHSPIKTGFQESLLKEQLSDLQNRYDHLKESKAKAAQRYNEDYRRWKTFKQWLLDPDEETFRERLQIMRRKDASNQERIESKPSLRTPEILEDEQHQDSSQTEIDSQAPHFPSVSISMENDVSAAPKTKFDNSRKIGRPLDDYLEFKGRGRYKNALQDDSETINAQFKIDKTRNDGIQYQFDVVVRNKEERKQLHASDCECCRDYYEAIGEMPPRLQAPLWRTPPSSLSAGASRSAPFAQDQAIPSHKKAISKHRQNWAMPATPPKYWSIGFPSTQEVLDINTRAEELNMRKRRAVEIEADSSNGRYQRR